MMRKLIPVILVLGFIFLSGFKDGSENYEQLSFDYFVSDILTSDFKDVRFFEFKGKTEESYSTLGKYRFCLRPEEKLGQLIGGIAKGIKGKVKTIEFENSSGLTITNFQPKSNGYRLFIYPALHVADNYYVFLSFQKQKEQPIRYVIELTPVGEISRSCKLD